MRKLILMRHGTASWNAPEDIDRPLNMLGKTDAARAGEWLMEEHQPSFAVVSPAKRTQMTLEGVKKSFPDLISETHTPLYPMNSRSAFQKVEALPDEHRCVLLVGHNPGISDLATYLTERYGLNFTPGEVLVITFETDSWKEVSAGTGSIADRFFPNP